MHRSTAAIIAAAFAAALPAATVLAGAGHAQAAEARRFLAGHMPDGRAVNGVTLENARGDQAVILAYGATLQRLIAPDCAGHKADLLLGYDDVADYIAHPNFFGVTVGRYANRIAGGSFVLDGKTYQVPRNENGNSLHGGGNGFDKALWRIGAVSSGAQAEVVLTHESPDGDAGYPGTLQVTASYALDEAGNLTIRYGAVTDKPTIVNMTNHAIFNLAGEGAPGGALNERLTIPAARYTPVDAALIPTGEERPVSGTVFDFRAGRQPADGVRNGKDAQIRFGRGYDQNFVLDAGLTKTPKLAARLVDPGSGRALEVWTDQPGVQLYTGNFLNGTLVGKAGHLYRMGDGIALEPQKFPDAPHHPNFESARVDPGAPYRHVMMYRLSTECGEH